MIKSTPPQTRHSTLCMPRTVRRNVQKNYFNRTIIFSTGWSPSFIMFWYFTISIILLFYDGLVHAAACTVTDGSVANEGDCTCGSEACTAITGLICYSTVGGGSCRISDPGAYGFPRPNKSAKQFIQRQNITFIQQTHARTHVLT